MAHARATIRAGLVAALAAAGTAASSRVFAERVNAAADTELPFIRFAQQNEAQSRAGYGGGRGLSQIERTYIVQVSYVQKLEAGYQDAGDEAMRLIEAAMASAVVAGVADIEPAGALFDEESDGEHQLYTVTQEFRITYNTPQGNPAQTI